MDKIVVHSKDGRILKGSTSDFMADSPFFHLSTIQKPFDPEMILLDNQKAVFFVRDFSGDATYLDLQYWNRAPDSGKHVVVTFKDGEKLFGTADIASQSRTGFFLHPMDPVANNIRVYVVHTSVAGIEIVD